MVTFLVFIRHKVSQPACTLASFLRQCGSVFGRRKSVQYVATYAFYSRTQPHKWNRRRLVSISFLCTHSNSPYLLSNVPFCRLSSLSVKRGPSSCMRAITAACGGACCLLPALAFDSFSSKM